MSLLSKRHVFEAIERAKDSHATQHRDNIPTWCPGCGHYSPLQGVYEALEELKIDPKNFVLVSGIGCSGRFPFFIKGFGFHGLHGRAVPIASGIKMANPELTVMVTGGDGDGVGIGGGHIPHAARTNIDLTYLLLDNSIYGLTKGQTSPTSPLGMVSSTTPYGNFARPLNPTVLAITYGATFVARGFSRDRHMLSGFIREAMAHKGFSLVHIISPCVEFNDTVTYDSVCGKTAPLPQDHNPADEGRALALARSEDPVYTGIFLKREQPSFDQEVNRVMAELKK